MAKNNFFKLRNGINVGSAENDPLVPDSTAGDVYFNTTQNTLRQFNGTVWSNIGSGGGLGVNYIENPDGEYGLDGYVSYQNSANVVPDDGTGGTPAGISITKTVDPLEVLYKDGSFKIIKDASDRQGMGVSYDFEIPLGYRERTQTINFIYKSIGNFSHGNGTFTQPSDLGVFIYDIDAGDIVPLGTNWLDGSGIFQTTFQPINGSSENYRIIFHVATNNAQAWEYVFDQIIVGPTNNTNAQLFNVQQITTVAKNDAQNFTGPTTAKVTFNSPIHDNFNAWDATNNRINILRDGHYNLSAQLQQIQTSGSSGDRSIMIYKNGAKLFEAKKRYSGVTDSDEELNLERQSVPLVTGDYLEVFYQTSGTSTDSITGNSSLNSTFSVQQIPLQTSNVILSSPANANPVLLSARISGNSGYAVSQPVIFNDTTSGGTFDPLSILDKSTGIVTIPETGYYQIDVRVGARSIYTNQNTKTIYLMTLAGVGLDISNTNVYFDNTVTACFLNSTLKLEAGLQFRILLMTNVNSTAYAGGVYSRLSIKKLVNPQSIASEGVKAVVLKDVKVSGTNGGSSSTSYITRDLNTMEGNYSFAALNANQFTLQPGSYIIEATAPFSSKTAGDTETLSKIKLRNVTDSTDDIIGTTSAGQSSYALGQNLPSSLHGYLTITSPKTFELQHRTSQAISSIGLGRAASFGDSEVYSVVKIIKLI